MNPIVDELARSDFHGNGPDRGDVEALAFRRYVENGRHDGYDVEDWLWAERQILWKLAENIRVVHPFNGNGNTHYSPLAN